MKVVFQIIRNHPTQLIPSIIIIFEKTKYIFNIPETLQRYLKFHNFRMSKGSKIFLTRLSTQNLTGLFGFLLTMYETRSCLETKLYGPKELINYMDSIKFLMGFKLLPYSCYGFNEKAKNKDENTLIGLNHLEVIDRLVQGRNYLTDFYNIKGYIDRELNNNVNEINNAGIHISFKENLYKDENITIIPIIFNLGYSKTNENSKGYNSFIEKQQISSEIISYICITTRPEAIIDKQKLGSYHLNKEQTIELFKTNQTTLSNGTILSKNDLQKDPPPASILIIIDCPNSEILDKLLNNEILSNFTKAKLNKNEYFLQSMIHLTEGGLAKDLKYQTFMEKFDCEHVLTSCEFFQLEENKLKLALLQQPFKHMKMLGVFHHYFPDNFPNISDYFNKHNQFFQSLEELTKEHLAKYDLEACFNGIKSKSLIKQRHQCSLIPIKPGFEAINSENLQINKKDSFEETSNFNKHYLFFLNAKKQFDCKKPEKINNNNQNNNIPNENNPLIVFLGTGSMIPASYRNVSGIYLDYGIFNLLLDCGEGTYFQLLNHFGWKKLHCELLLKLKVIFISHIHVDHHAGIFQMLFQRNLALKAAGLEAKENTLFLVIPENLVPWYIKYTHYVEDFEGVSVVLNQNLGSGDVKKNFLNSYSMSKSFLYASESLKLEFYEDPLLKPLLETMKTIFNDNLIEFQKFLMVVGMKEFLTVLVDHCPQAHGIVITHNSGIKIVYSGDTRPCENLVKYGKNATILIHEATFNDSLAKNASENMHSTVGEAVEVGMRMGVWRLILTHFSQRFSKNVVSKDEEEKMMAQKEKDHFEFLKEKTVFAFDHFGATVEEFEFMPLINQCMGEMFLEDEEK